MAHEFLYKSIRKRVGEIVKNKIGKYIQSYGMRKTFRIIYSKLNKENQKRYDAWRKNHALSEEILERQKNYLFRGKNKFSIVVPLYKTNEKYLRELVESVLNQTYADWELCLSDGSGKDSPLKALLMELKKRDSRIRVVDRECQMQISENTNQAIAIASGDYLVFMDHDDLLTPDALYECAYALEQHPEADLLYSDEDKISMDGKMYFEPHFKPDYNQDLLCSVNYFCHLVVVSKKITKETKGLNPEFDGAQDYDFVLRCTEKTKKIYHIPKILYHWRAHIDSTAENPESKRYAFEAGRRAIQAHYERMGRKHDLVENTEYPGLYRTRYMIEEEPKISIVVEAAESEELKRCIESIEACGWNNYEIIVTASQNLFNQLKAVERQDRKEKAAGDGSGYLYTLKTGERIRTIYNTTGKTNAEARNEVIVIAEGKYLLYMQGDTVIRNKESLREMVGICMREEVACVGAKICYGKNIVEHAGVILGLKDMRTAGYAFRGIMDGEHNYFSRMNTQMEYSAVAGSGVMIKKIALELIGGFDENLTGALGIIDVCLRTGERGMLSVYTPYANMYHEQVEREQGEKEKEYFYNKWKEKIQNGDSNYNINLSLESYDFKVRTDR